MRLSRIQEAVKARAGQGWARAVPWLVQLLSDGFPLVLGLWIAARVLTAFAGRVDYPYDLEWMEGGMLAHAWRVQQWYPLYAEPGPDWIPYIYPPGYPALLAALSPVTGLSPTVGRAVSVVGTLGTCAALVFGGWRHGKSALAGGLAALVFLALYPDTGAFYDLVRPDSLAVALLAWSIVLGIDADRRLRLASGVLLAVAFAVKHNTAAYGLPMALGIAVRFGVAEALWFGLASAGPALLFTGVMQLYSGGHFLTTLLGIAGAHPMVYARFLPGAIEELGKHVGLAALGCSVALVGFTIERTRGRAPRLVVAGLALLVGAVMVVRGMQLPAAARMPQPTEWVEQSAWLAIGLAAGAVFGAGSMWPKGRARVAMPLGALVVLPVFFLFVPPWVVKAGLSVPFWAVSSSLTVGALVGLFVAAIQHEVDGRWLYGVGIGSVALITAGLMRAHHGGFLNVYIPMHMVLSLSLAVGVGMSRQRWPRLEVYLVGGLVFGGQLWGHRDFEPERYVPVQADVDAGDRFVEALKECEGPVLSPFNPWLPVQAGHAPSFHLIALWDINHPKGPYHADMEVIREASQSHYWGCVVSGSGRPLGFGIQKSYGVWKTPPVPRAQRQGRGPPTFMPRTGWRVRPQSILVPR